MNTSQSAELVDTNFGLDSDADQHLTFLLAGEEYGVDILRVQEIKGWDRVTPIPNTPDFIKGVINLRGTIVPIVDLRTRFAMEEVEYGPMTVVIVLKVVGAEKERVMGVVVDAVSEVYNITVDEMKPAPDFGDTIDIEYVKGLATIDDKMVIVLDIDQLLTNSALESEALLAGSPSAEGAS